jgi:hypothetical protein
VALSATAIQTTLDTRAELDPSVTPSNDVTPQPDVPDQAMLGPCTVTYRSRKDVIFASRVPEHIPIRNATINDLLLLRRGAVSRESVGVEIHRASEVLNAMQRLYPEHTMFHGGFPVRAMLEAAFLIGSGLDVTKETRELLGKARFIVGDACMPEEDMLALMKRE